MARKSAGDSKTKVVSRKLPPAVTPDDRENQLIYYATNLAEEQLRQGTASSQVITHYLRLGSSQMRLEKARLEAHNKLLAAKTEALESEKRTEELYTEAIRAFREYRGESDEDNEEN